MLAKGLDGHAFKAPGAQSTASTPTQAQHMATAGEVVISLLCRALRGLAFLCDKVLLSMMRLESVHLGVTGVRHWNHKIGNSSGLFKH